MDWATPALAWSSAKRMSAGPWTATASSGWLVNPFVSSRARYPPSILFFWRDVVQVSWTRLRYIASSLACGGGWSATHVARCLPDRIAIHFRPDSLHCRLSPLLHIAADFVPAACSLPSGQNPHGRKTTPLVDSTSCACLSTDSAVEPGLWPGGT